MDAGTQQLLAVVGEPFDGQDVVQAVNSATVLDNLKMVFSPIASEDFVSEMVADSSFREERVGIQGFLDAWRDWAAPWESLRLEVIEVTEMEGGIFTEVAQAGVPKGGSTEMKQRAAAVWWMDEGRLTRVEFHLDLEVARRAAGL